MSEYNDFLELRQLSLDVLNEVIREGEVKLAAQFTAANSSDQRALSWAGFLIAIATASIGGTIALIVTDQNLWLATMASFFLIATLSAIFLAISCVKPSDFMFPGNDPENWFPSEWYGYKRSKLDIKQARIEQAFAIHNAIKHNKDWSEKTNSKLQLSMNIMLYIIIIISALIFFYNLYLVASYFASIPFLIIVAVKVILLLTGQ